MESLFVDFIEGKNEKAPIIMLHGDYQNHSVFYGVVGFFTEKGNPIILIDLPGNGFSASKECDLSGLLEKIVSDRGIKKPAIFGNSFGGLVGVDYAKKNEVSSLILLNSPIFNLVKLFPDKNLEDYLSQYESLSEQMFKSQSFIDYSKLNALSDEALFATGIQATSLTGVRNNLNFYKSFYQDYDLKINNPALLIVSKSYWMMPLDVASEWLSTDNKRKLEEIGGNHNILIQDPSSVCKVIDKNYDFLFSDTL